MQQKNSCTGSSQKFSIQSGRTLDYILPSPPYLGVRFRSHTELQSQAPPPDTDTFLKRKCTGSITVCQNNVTLYSSSRTRTACLARGSKNYLPVRPPNLLKRKKTHPSTVPNQNLIRRIQPVQRKKKVHFSQTTCTLQELSVSQINGKGKSFVSACASLAHDGCIPLATFLPSLRQTFTLRQPQGVPLQRREPAES